MLKTRIQGFTIPELVIAIVLIGIVAAVTLSRFLRDDAYNAAIVRDQLVSMSRAAQQKAIGRADVSLRIQQVGDQLRFVIEDDSGSVQTSSVDRDAVSLSYDVNVVQACNLSPASSVFGPGSNLRLSFDQLGNLVTAGAVGSEQPVTRALRLCVNNDPRLSVCVSPAGFAHVGECLP